MITFADLLSPLRRQALWLVTSFMFITALTLGGLYYGLPSTEKTTLYYSVKPVASTEAQTSLDPIESTMKAAEGMSGWAKNPAFRQAIMDEAGIYVPNFKRKITARKQDRINVFWTLNLTAEQSPIIAATQKIIEADFATWNQANAAPFAMTPITIFTEGRTIPFSWLILFSLTLGATLAILIVLMRELIGGKVSFLYQIQQLFGASPLLQISENLGRHDQALLEQFILTFESPRLIGTFPAAEEHFSLSPRDSINGQSDTPILLVQLGKTTQRDLANMKAIFGEGCGLIVFEK